jgi:hypothetical protein
MLATSGADSAFRGIDFVPDLRPLITAQPASQVVTNGAGVAFEVTATSPYVLGYQWQKNGASLSGMTISALALPSVTAAAQGNYQVVVTNQYGSVTSAVASLTVNTVEVSPSITIQPAGQSVLIGSSVTFSVAAAGTPQLYYQWQYGGADLPGQTNVTLSLPNVAAAAAGGYRVLISNLGGSATSDVATLTVLIPEASFVPYTSPGLVYTQHFDSLPNPLTDSVNADNPVTIDGLTYGLSDPFDFAFPLISNGVSNATGIGFGGLGLLETMPGWYGVADVQPKFGACEGDQSTGGVISFGLTNSPSTSTNRALGLMASSSTGGTAIGIKLINQTAGTLDQITLGVTGELWRQAAVAKTMVFSYWIDPGATNPFPATSTGVLTNLNVSFPIDPAATNPVPVNGLAPANQLSAGVVNQPIADWTPGAALWLVWRMADSTAKGQGLAIDDLTFSASSPAAPVSLAIQSAGASVLLSWAVTTTVYTLQSSPALGAASTWSAVNQPVVVTNGLNTLMIPVTTSCQFFRLEW